MVDWAGTYADRKSAVEVIRFRDGAASESAAETETRGPQNLDRRISMTDLEARMVDPTHLELSEPVDLPRGSKLVVSVVEADDGAEDRQQWLAASAVTLQAAYSDSEPDYSLDLLKERNPEYER